MKIPVHFHQMLTADLHYNLVQALTWKTQQFPFDYRF